ncbi:MAG: histidine phosphatase family protein [Nitrospirae bacterium]|nr:histidine phosphatase family protein [Nitrospirota bacterium]
MKELRLKYLLMRHGESVANATGIVASTASSALDGYGLTPKGIRQVEAAISQSELMKIADVDSSAGSVNSAGSVDSAISSASVNSSASSAAIIIYSSDFLRARQSALIAGRLLKTEVRFDPRLRERNFGDLEMGSTAAYAQIWPEDLKNPAHKKWGVESVNEVLARMLDFLSYMESAESAYRESVEGKSDRGEKTALIVSHGDPLQILQAYFLFGDPRKHGSNPMENAELAELQVLRGVRRR